MYQVINEFIKLGHYRNGFFFIPLLFFLSINTFGQQFNTHWIYAPQSDSTSHVWFRRAFISNGRPQQATITVASTGYYKLYVNECNVGTALFYPTRSTNDSTAISSTFDVTPYLRSDTNVIALIYSPVFPSINRKQISVSIYGTDHSGKKFCHISDNSWICRRANSQMTIDGGEIIDGIEHDPSWKAATIYNLAQWIHTEAFTAKATEIINIYNGPEQVMVTRNTSLNNLHISQNPISLYLAHSFWGFPRITLREARRGEKIQIGNLTYTCNGTMDEQAYPIFNIKSYSTLNISGDSHFKPNQITTIELLEVKKSSFSQ